ncbi:MAG: exo-alpha-sialidase [Cyclobacteriaceae bacterium]|nr:exo-alpha-sialidase [Cyclobacteriaceae bacterium]
MMRCVLIMALLITACSAKDEFAVIPVPAQIGSAEPFLFTDEDGQVYLSWVAKTDSLSSLKYSKFAEGKWLEPVRIASGKNWFVNWADYPMLAVNKNNFVAHFLEKSGDDTFAYDVKLSTSADGNKWSTPFVIHDDGKQAEHGFVSLLPYGDNFMVAWLDGRNTVMEGMENIDHHDGHHGEMTLRAAIINAAGNKISEWELDPRTCDCCQTTTALTSNGPVVIYRDRSEEEIRDIFITRFVDNEWTKPQAVYADNWKIAGCPVNGPRADAIGNAVAIAWFTAANNQPTVKIIFSTTGGETFSQPIQVNTDETIGRVDVVMLNSNSAVVSWMEASTIKAMRINSDGSKGNPITIASTSEARSSGFPQITRAGDKLVFAWTNDLQKTILSTVVDVHTF